MPRLAQDYMPHKPHPERHTLAAPEKLVLADFPSQNLTAWPRQITLEKVIKNTVTRVRVPKISKKKPFVYKISSLVSLHSCAFSIFIET